MCGQLTRWGGEGREGGWARQSPLAPASAVHPGRWGVGTGLGPGPEVFSGLSLPGSFPGTRWVSPLPWPQPLFFSCRVPKVAAVPTYEEAVCCPLAAGPPTPPAQPVEEGLEDRASGDALLGAQCPPPPSYESIVGAGQGICGQTVPGPGCSCPGPAQAAAGGP